MDIGKLYIISTPIGNLEDITYRAIDTLKKCDYICCEDSRKTNILLQHYKIQKRIILYADYNKNESTEKIIELLKQNYNIGLVTDAGTPCISDPGYFLIKCCRENNIKVIPIPGVSAITTALSISGLPTDTFYFYGFLPNSETKKIKILNKLKYYDTTLIFFESAKKLIKTLKILKKIFYDKNIVLARELTKKFEDIKLLNLKTINLDNIMYKGEFVILLDNSRATKKLDYKIIENLYTKLNELDIKKNLILKIISESFNIKKNKLYDYLKNE
jgi:16S rRNA (cytidine1402-2'-O)-methyltransferase